MHIISKTTVKQAMVKHPQWKPGLSLWLKVIGSGALQFQSYAQLKQVWKAASGWNVDRIPGPTIREGLGGKQESRAVYSDVYVFDIHGSECRIVCRFVAPNKLYIRLIGPHSVYDKWWNDHTGYKRKSK